MIEWMFIRGLDAFISYRVSNLIVEICLIIGAYFLRTSVTSTPPSIKTTAKNCDLVDREKNDKSTIPTVSSSIQRESQPVVQLYPSN